MLTAVCQRCAVGERVCGDDWAVVQAGAAWLLAVIDGLGHGPQAQHAAALARQALQRSPDLPLDQLVGEMGRALKSSRGACVGLARVDPETRKLSCVIVGNVEIAGDGHVRPVPSPGIVGREIRKLRVFEGPFARGDRLYLYSDGISRKVQLTKYRALVPQQAANAVVREFGQSHDDATCLVAELVP
ncbi:MAG: SpoIIE family protein phosphatase [Myxococcales bacterium]